MRQHHVGFQLMMEEKYLTEGIVHWCRVSLNKGPCRRSWISRRCRQNSNGRKGNRNKTKFIGGEYEAHEIETLNEETWLVHVQQSSWFKYPVVADLLSASNCNSYLEMHIYLKFALFKTKGRPEYFKVCWEACGVKTHRVIDWQCKKDCNICVEGTFTMRDT